MARRNRFKAKNLATWIAMVLGVIAGVGVGGLFVNGTMLTVPILSYLPEVAHTLVGWGMIIGSVGSLVLSFIK
jgi:hypothetical protein